MPLSRLFNQGRLLYFNHDADAISVYENHHLRWLTFDDVVQSAIRINQPHRLTFPHQWALLMPLLNFTPKKVVELGLGAGSHLQFTHWLGANINHQVIEYNQHVIDIARRYFSLNTFQHSIVHQEAGAWLSAAKNLNDDWYIFDIYQQAKFHDNSYNQLLSDTVLALGKGSILSINFPEATEKEVVFWLKQLATKTSHQVHCYTVPHYKNIVLHLIPNHPNPTLTQTSPLPNRIAKYWQRYQLQFGIRAT